MPTPPFSHSSAGEMRSVSLDFQRLHSPKFLISFIFGGKRPNLFLATIPVVCCFLLLSLLATFFYCKTCFAKCCVIPVLLLSLRVSLLPAGEGRRRSTVWASLLPMSSSTKWLAILLPRSLPSASEGVASSAKPSPPTNLADQSGKHPLASFPLTHALALTLACYISGCRVRRLYPSTAMARLMRSGASGMVSRAGYPSWLRWSLLR